MDVSLGGMARRLAAAEDEIKRLRSAMRRAMTSLNDDHDDIAAYATLASAFGEQLHERSCACGITGEGRCPVCCTVA